VENPRYLKEELPALRRAGRSVSRKKKGGHNRRKAVQEFVSASSIHWIRIATTSMRPETYPPSSAWGSDGWTFRTLEEAETRLELVGRCPLRSPLLPRSAHRIQRCRQPGAPDPGLPRLILENKLTKVFLNLRKLF
jgi:hypothetical protein